MNYFLSFVVLWSLAVTSLQAAEPPKHRFLCVDNGKNLLIYVDQIDPARSWHVSIPAGSRDLQLLPPDKPVKVLVSHGNGAAEYDLATGKKLEWMVDRYSAIQSAVRLENGQTALCGVDGTIYHLEKDGRERSHAKPDIKMNVRLMRPLDNGNVMLSGAGPCEAFEMSLDGKIVRRIPLPTGAKGYKSVALANGNVLTSTGDLCKLAEIDKDGKIVSFVGGKVEHPDIGLDFVSGWDVLKNGNKVVANWLGHGKQGKGVHLAEFTPENKLIWTWADHELARQITNVLMLE